MSVTINGKTYTAENICDAIYNEFRACARGKNTALVLARELACVAVYKFGFTWNEIDALELKAYGIR